MSLLRKTPYQAIHRAVRKCATISGSGKHEAISLDLSSKPCLRYEKQLQLFGAVFVLNKMRYNKSKIVVRTTIL